MGFAQEKYNCMKTKYFLAILPIISMALSHANGQNSHWKSYLDLSFSGSKNHGAIAPGWSFLYGLGEKRKFNIGTGLRYTAAFSRNTEFTTAPARLTSGKEGPQVLFSEDIPENVDTFMVGRAQHHAVNLAIYLQYDFTPKFQVGFNIDGIGFSFGPEVRGSFQSLQSDNIGLQNVEAKPTLFNLLLVSDNDFGTLNSELYARYFFKERWAVKGGATFLFTEYKTKVKPAFDNNRFRHKSLQFMLGVTFIPFKK